MDRWESSGGGERGRENGDVITRMCFGGLDNIGCHERYGTAVSADKRTTEALE
jgi:hypothetical protein